MNRMRKGLWLAVAIPLTVFMGLGCATTQKAAAPVKAEAQTDWKFHDIVDVDFVKQYAKVPQPEGVMIIDSRPYKPKYVKGYIPTAVNIPDSQFDKMVAKLPKDKNAVLIFYCEGPT